MRYQKLDLNLLVALDALLAQRNVTRAAAQLHISQSAASNALGRLRRYFGDELLARVGRRMELTPRAEALREAVHDVLLRVDAGITTQPGFDPARSEREFRLHLSDYMALSFMPRFMALAGREAPHVRFTMLRQGSQPLQAIERGEADVLVLPGPYCTPEHPQEPLYHEGYCCVVWRGSRIARRRLSRQAYLDAGHVVMEPPGRANPAYESRELQRLGVQRRIEVSTYSFVAAATLVIGTERIATVHQRLARTLARSLPLALRPMPIPLEPMRQVMQWHRHRTQDPGLLWLRGLMARAGRQLRSNR